MPRTIFTIGHSNHTRQRLVELLQMHGVTAICDVRSQPYSRIHPQFNREELREFLQASDIAYSFLGKELGARSQDPRCYKNGRVQYDRIAETPLFQSGIQRLEDGSQSYRMALMCAEKEPLECHRTILVSRSLAAFGWTIQHIHADGKLEDHAAALDRLARELNIPEMFLSPDEVRMEAYQRQADLIAYSLPTQSYEPVMALGSALP